MTPETLHFDDDGAFPNSRLPVLLYRGVDGVRGDGEEALALFAAHGWTGGWVDGIYPFHHFHSTAHEVLGIAAGTGRVALGGPQGRALSIGAGDVLVLPAGTGHGNEGSEGLVVAGAYPAGQQWDLRRGERVEHRQETTNIAGVALPAEDPIGGSLLDVWS
ncbi:MAG: cupin [Solirubrobacteraceae bacterium]